MLHCSPATKTANLSDAVRAVALTALSSAESHHDGTGAFDIATARDALKQSPAPTVDTIPPAGECARTHQRT
jgi:hypothetical protein